MPAQALLLVDIQNDFLPGGALAVAGGDEVVPVANRLMAGFELVVATQDWHPGDHLSFASQHPGMAVGEFVELRGVQQVLWPDHCVQGSTGAAFAPGLDVEGIARTIRKGTDRDIDSYSGFFDNARMKETGLHALLAGRGVRSITVAGLATDYCVKATVLDALELDYEVAVVTDGVRGVELAAGDSKRAFEDMRAAGAKLEGAAP